MTSNSTTWSVNALRATTFPTPVSPYAMGSGSDWWKLVDPNPPIEESTNKRESTYSAVGEFQSGLLQLSVQPSRADWFVVPKPPAPDMPIPPFQKVGGMELIDQFINALQGWFAQLSSVRLAFGAVLVCDANDRVDGYKHLQKYLHELRLDAEGSSDFVYQINRPRISQVTGMRVNRVSKWAVVHPVTIQLNPQSLVANSSRESLHVARLELDVSTVAENSEILPQDTLANQFRELTSLACEIAKEGDIK